MKRAISGSLKVAGLLLILFSTSQAQLNLPQPQGMMNDFSGALSPETRSHLENLLRNFRDRTGIEVALVTMSADDLQGYPIEEYSLQLGRQWGIGRDSEKAAALLLIAIKPPDQTGRYSGFTRLEISRRLEGDIPDGLAGELIRRMRDNFRAGRFDEALTQGVQTILSTIAAKRGLSIEGIDQRYAYRQPAAAPQRRSRGISPSLIILGIFILFVIIGSIRGGGGGRGGRGRRGGGGSDWMLLPFIFGGGGSGGFGGYSGGSSWGGSGGGGGGGFGGFGGGGDFGGGGASDSW